MFTSGHPGHFTLGAASKVLKELFKTPKTSPQDLQQAPAAADVNLKGTALGLFTWEVCKEELFAF